MIRFSEESLLLVENWDTVEDILRSVERFQAELSSLLRSTESDLAQRDWWQDGWRFVLRTDSQAYISREDWRVDDSFLVWIGVERFTPAAVVGTDSAPQLYVWVQNNQHNLAETFAEAIETSEEEVLGDVDHSHSGYVVRHPVAKSLPGEVDGLEDSIIGQVVGFFAHWAQALSRFDETIRDHVASLKKETSAAGQ